MTAYALTPASVIFNTTVAQTLIGPVPAGEEWVVDVRCSGGYNSGSGQTIESWLTSDTIAANNTQRSNYTTMTANTDVESGLVIPAGYRIIVRGNSAGMVYICWQATGVRRLTA